MLEALQLFGFIKGDFLSSLKRNLFSEVSEYVISCPQDSNVYIKHW